MDSFIVVIKPIIFDNIIEKCIEIYWNNKKQHNKNNTDMINKIRNEFIKLQNLNFLDSMFMQQIILKYQDNILLNKFILIVIDIFM